MDGVLWFLNFRAEVGGEEVQSAEALAEDGFGLGGDGVRNQG
jgi:hypothetical protein